MWALAGLAVALAAATTPVTQEARSLDWATLPATIHTRLADEGIAPDDWEVLQERRILTRRRPLQTGEGGAHVAALALVEAPVETVWSVVADCGRLPEFMPNFVACDDVEPDAPLLPHQRWNRNRLEFGTFPLRFRIDMIVEADLHPPELLRWRRVRGDTRRNEDYWHLIEIGPRAVILVYDVSTDAGAVPDFVQRALTTRDLPGTVEAVRQRAEGFQ